MSIPRLVGTLLPRAAWWPYFAALALIVLAICAAFVFRRLPHANLSLLFLAVVLVIAVRWGLWPSIFASLISFLVINLLFTPPLYTLAVEEEGDIATLLFFLAMAALTGNLASRMRAEMASRQGALQRVSALLDFSGRMAGAQGAEQVLDDLVARLAATLRVPVSGVLGSDASPACVRAMPAGMYGSTAGWRDAKLDADGLKAIWRQAEAGAAPRVRGCTVWSLATSTRTVGSVVVESTDIPAQQRALAEGFCDQATVALERTMLVDSLREAQRVYDAERLRSALLSSVSHDLKTPLASIIGSTTSLIEYGELMTLEDRRELRSTVLEESQRLNRYIQNLLDMTRFGQQSFELNREWVDLNDLVSSAVERLGTAMSHVGLEVDVDPDVTLIRIHGALIEQVLVNLLDNAAAHAPEGSTIEVRTRRDGAAAIIDVMNEGPQIPESERERVFDMFYRVSFGDRQRPGTGLGLAICRSVVAAHGGTIAVVPHPDREVTVMRIELPIAENSVGSVVDDR